MDNTWETFLSEAQRFIDFCENKNLSIQQVLSTQPPKKKHRVREPIPETQQDVETVTSGTAEPDHPVVMTDYAVTGQDRIRILTIMNQFLSDSQNKGKKFRRAHDMTLRDEPFVIPILTVDSNTGTQPACVICQEKILRGVPRCKFSVVHHGYPPPTRSDVMVDLCQTHVYHALCYAVHFQTLREGYEMVCFGTCLCDRGGCRQPKKITV